MDYCQVLERGFLLFVLRHPDRISRDGGRPLRQRGEGRALVPFQKGRERVLMSVGVRAISLTLGTVDEEPDSRLTAIAKCQALAPSRATERARKQRQPLAHAGLRKRGFPIIGHSLI